MPCRPAVWFGMIPYRAESTGQRRGEGEEREEEREGGGRRRGRGREGRRRPSELLPSLVRAEGGMD